MRGLVVPQKEDGEEDLDRIASLIKRGLEKLLGCEVSVTPREADNTVVMETEANLLASRNTKELISFFGGADPPVRIDIQSPNFTLVC